jgi:nucleoside-triphosphatase THEP1
MAAYVELYIDQGTTFNNVINITDDTTNTPVNVFGYTVTSQMRRSYYSANATANIICTVTDAPNGEITMTMSSSNTANIKAGRYLFDVKTIDETETSIVSRILEGIITVTPQTTK